VFEPVLEDSVKKLEFIDMIKDNSWGATQNVKTAEISNDEVFKLIQEQKNLENKHAALLEQRAKNQQLSKPLDKDLETEINEIQGKLREISKKL
jgi:septal ring factor EnvC (AmiA/AmiB activator)